MSIIATGGVFIGSAALIIILSVFNGFESLVVSLYNSFDADLQITATKGKTFVITDKIINDLNRTNGIADVNAVLEENVLLKYNDLQYFATIKGMDAHIAEASKLSTLVVDGKLKLLDGNMPYACIGFGVASALGISPKNMITPLTVYVPNRFSKANFTDGDAALTIRNINVSSVFSVQQDFDAKYIIVPIGFTRELLSYDKELTSVEINLKDGFSESKLQQSVQTIVGNNFKVKTKAQQHDLLYKIMTAEKWAVFFILVFILIVASFNIIASLTMLIIEKQKDIAILKSLGATATQVTNIFLFQGTLISLYGAIGGIITGIVVCLLQQQFGFVTLGGAGSFVIDAYPVKLLLMDIIYVLITVVFIGYLAAMIAVQSLKKIDKIGIATIIKNND
jgi:ABC-type lipoprotein release transport system permease subunit